MSVDEYTLQNLLKYAEIIAMFKNLNSLCKGNYRNISVLTVLSIICLENIWPAINIVNVSVFS